MTDLYLIRHGQWDGVLPLKQGGLQPEDIEHNSAYIKEHRSTETPFDIVKIGITPGDNPTRGSKIVAPFADAGATWWLESLFTKRNSIEEMRHRIQQGPPRI